MINKLYIMNSIISNLNIFFQYYIQLCLLENKKYNYPFLLKCRKISKNIGLDELLPNNLNEKLKLYEKYHDKKKKICTGCLRKGYFANHFGYCVNCRSEYVPEISSTIAQKNLGIMKDYLSLVPYRYSQPPTRKAFKASHLWSIMKYQCEQEKKSNKCKNIVTNGTELFYKLVFQICIK